MVICELVESEFDEWLDLLQGAFAAKKTPREYFERHWTNDPFKTTGFKDIIVSKDAVGQLLASLRLFNRSMLIGDQFINIVGIGEVACKTEYRMNGFVGGLISSTLNSNRGEVFILHSGAHLYSFYQKFGFKQMPPVEYLQVTCVVRMPQGFLQQMNWRDTNALHELMSLYNKSMSNGRFVRSIEYWSTWIQRELECKEWALLVDKLSPDDSIQSYAICDVNGEAGVVDVKEFLACDIQSGFRLMKQLIQLAQEHFGPGFKVKFMIGMMPGNEIMELLQQESIWTLHRQEIFKDEGWFYYTQENSTTFNSTLTISRVDYF